METSNLSVSQTFPSHNFNAVIAQLTSEEIADLSLGVRVISSTFNLPGHAPVDLIYFWASTPRRKTWKSVLIIAYSRIGEHVKRPRELLCVQNPRSDLQVQFSLEGTNRLAWHFTKSYPWVRIKWTKSLSIIGHQDAAWGCEVYPFSKLKSLSRCWFQLLSSIRWLRETGRVSCYPTLYCNR